MLAAMEVTAAATFCATLVDELAGLGLTDAVIAPGSRSTPMALALDADARVRVHVHVDERSAAFVALGLSRATGRAAAVLTTSGTAAVELHPAVVEASYDRVPLVALTADRPPELHGVGAPQTIDQRELYGRAARAYVDAGVPDDVAPERWRPLAREVWDAAHRGRPGPVQLDLPFREPLVGRPGPLPPADAPAGDRPNGRPGALDDAVVDRVARAIDGRRGVIVAGGHVDHPEAVLELADHLGWPVFADPRSGCRVPHPAVVGHFDAVLRAGVCGGGDEPEAVLRLGSLPASKVLTQWLAGLGPDVCQLGIDAHGARFDVDGRLDEVIEAAPGALSAALVHRTAGASDRTWLERWFAAERRASEVIARVLAQQGALTEPAVARIVTGGVPDGSDLVLSSSMPVREVEWYAAARRGLRVLANRGANGIDGVVSTAVGVALAGAPTTALLGDLAFLHDVNGLLGVTGRDVDLTLVVVDNDGGGIFSFLPQAQALPRHRYERLFGTPHGLDLVQVARAHGVDAYEVVAAEELADALDHRCRSPRALVVRTDRGANVGVHDTLHAEIAAALTDA